MFALSGIKDDDKQVKRYDAEKAEIKATADALAKSKEDAQARAGNFGYGLILLQISIMLASISAPTKKKPRFYLSVATVSGWIFFFLTLFFYFIEYEELRDEGI
ncbi:MAG: DUF4337 family protein [Syntrophales bacterium]